DVRMNLPRPSDRKELSNRSKEVGPDWPGKITGCASLYFSGDIIKSRTGRLFATVYGRLQSDKAASAFLVQSDMNGKVWDYVTTIADGRSVTLWGDEKSTFGFAQPRIIRLVDGSLLVAGERGGDNYVYQAKSHDDGKS